LKPIYIVTDSTADLSEEQIKQYGIHMIPLSIQIDEKTFTDRVDLQPDEFLTLMAEAKELPKSSQPPVGLFKQIYDELGQDGAQILSIHMTSGMSGTYQTAQAAANMSESNVTVIDSAFISHALSFQVVEAAEMAQQGYNMEEIVKRVEEIKKATSLYVVVDKLDNLVKGGRIGKGKALIGSLLNIKPIATLQEGVYTPGPQVRSHKQVVKHLFKAFTEQTAGKIIKKVGIAHANGLAMAEPLKKLLEEYGVVDIPLTITTPVISTHTGEGAIGFMFYAE